MPATLFAPMQSGGMVGIHLCPCAPLARMELRLVLEELLGRTSALAPDPVEPATPTHYPDSGCLLLYLQIS
ncbi:hypothetical protein [Paracoccus actinidiae]|uniref:hypothetical protein n=1 Tax=Paracoccus actinidiae TaxID=3064531 RepID=UPI0027D2DC34|nr:hypothetical protein [Paracoccus sp. M09]